MRLTVGEGSRRGFQSTENISKLNHISGWQAVAVISIKPHFLRNNRNFVGISKLFKRNYNSNFKRWLKTAEEISGPFMAQILKKKKKKKVYTFHQVQNVDSLKLFKQNFKHQSYF